MSIDIKKHLKREPQLYRDIELYPILLFDVDVYQIFLEIMCIPKQYISNKDIMRMSYLKYLLFFIQGTSYVNNVDPTGNAIVDKLVKLLEYVTHKDICIIKKYYDYKDDFYYEIYIGDRLISEYEFEEIREIVLEQNGQSVEYIESFDPELEKVLNFTNKGGSGSSLNDRIFIYTTITNVDMDNMSNWTITEFEKKEKLLKIYEEWKVYKPLEASGQIEIKAPGKIESPFEYSENKKSRYDSILINADDFEKDLKQFSE